MSEVLQDKELWWTAPVAANLASTALQEGGFKHSIDDLDLAGTAELLTHAWKRWQTASRAFKPPVEPEKYRTVSFDQIAAAGKGWKLHLNFDPENGQGISITDSFLSELKTEDAITDYKIGAGGGKACGQPGKEATVYVGHRDKAVLIAKLIESSLDKILKLPEGDTLLDDTSFTPKVMGRFEIMNFDPDFHQYGGIGIPFLEDDMQRLVFSKDLGHEQAKAQARETANSLLTARYGTFYAGSEGLAQAK
jgi:hypothetical protein